MKALCGASEQRSGVGRGGDLLLRVDERVAAGVAQAIQHQAVGLGHVGRRPAEQDAVGRRILRELDEREVARRRRARREQRRAERARKETLVRDRRRCRSPSGTARTPRARSPSPASRSSGSRSGGTGRSFRSSCSSGRRNRRRRCLRPRTSVVRSARVAWSTFGNSEADTQLRSMKHASDFGPRGRLSGRAKARSPDARGARPRRRAGSPCRSPPASRGPATAPRGKSDRKRSCSSRSPPAACPRRSCTGPGPPRPRRRRRRGFRPEGAPGGCRAGARRLPSRRTTPSRRGFRRPTAREDRRTPGRIRRRRASSGRPAETDRRRQVPRDADLHGGPLGSSAAAAAVGRLELRPLGRGEVPELVPRALRQPRRGEGEIGAPGSGLRRCGGLEDRGPDLDDLLLRILRAEDRNGRGAEDPQPAGERRLSHRFDDNPPARGPMPAAARVPSGIRPSGQSSETG